MKVGNPVADHNRTHAALKLDSGAERVEFDSSEGGSKTGGSGTDQDSVSVCSEDSIKMPSILKNKSPSGPSDLMLKEDFLKLNLEDCIQQIGNLPHPALFANWSLWDCNKDVMNDHHMMRLCLDPTSEVEEVQLSWIGAKTFQV